MEQVGAVALQFQLQSMGVQIPPEGNQLLVPGGHELREFFTQAKLHHAAPLHTPGLRRHRGLMRPLPRLTGRRVR